MMPVYVSPNLYRTTSAVGAASNITAPADNSIKEGFFSCLRQVSNSLVSMKNAIVRGFERMTHFSCVVAKQTVETQSPEEKIKSGINPISCELTDKICTVLRGMISNENVYIRAMFRANARMKVEEFNDILKSPEAELLEKIETKAISGVDMGILIKAWFRDVIEDHNKFSPDEVRTIVSSTDDRVGDVVTDLLKNKYNDSNENYTKILSLLSVFKTYLQVCKKHNEHLPEAASSVVLSACAPTLCDMSRKTPLMLLDISAELMAVEKVLEHCPPPIPLSTRPLQVVPTPVSNIDTDTDSYSDPDYETLDNMKAMILAGRSDPEAISEEWANKLFCEIKNSVFSDKAQDFNPEPIYAKVKPKRDGNLKDS